jgi:signal peptidase I
MRFDFPTVMVLLVVVSGAIWAIDRFFLAPRRLALARRSAKGSQQGNQQQLLSPPKVVEYARSFFPVFLIVLVLRSFLVEPFRIPSGSMMPTLLIGDFILVNKFTYGIRLPITDTKIIPIDQPKRGDVMVFRYPEDPSTPFIKRVVGLPGDRIGYFNKVVYVNGQPAQQDEVETFVGQGSGRNMTGASVHSERLSSLEHQILIQQGYPSVEGEMVVPEGHYFVLGDNRDNSRDSRFWGTVPDSYLIGKAFTIWMNWDWGHGIDWTRIGMSIR